MMPWTKAAEEMMRNRGMTETEWLACSDVRVMVDFLRGKVAGIDQQAPSGLVYQFCSYPECRVSDRKLRLFGCACCRRIWHLLTDERSRVAVDVAEQFADGRATAVQLRQAYRAANDLADSLFDAALADAEAESARMYPDEECIYGDHDCAQAVSAAVIAPTGIAGELPMPKETAERVAQAVGVARYPVNFVEGLAADYHEREALIKAERVQHAELLRCIMGNPFRRVSRSVAWLAWNEGTIPKLAETIYTDRAFDRLPLLADALEDAGCTDADILAHCRGPGPHVRGCWVVDLLLGKK